MTDIVTLRKEAIDCAQRAVDFDNAENYEEAARLYIMAAEKLNFCSKVDTVPINKETYKNKAMGYATRAQELKEHIEAKETEKKKPVLTGGEYDYIYNIT